MMQTDRIKQEYTAPFGNGRGYRSIRSTWKARRRDGTAGLNRNLRGAAAFVVLLSIAACTSSGGQKAERELLGPGDQVRLIPREPSFPLNDHPVRFSSADMQILLAAIRVEPRTGEIPSGSNSICPENENCQYANVFSSRDIQQAAPVIARAFANAAPDQDIALSLSQLRASDTVTFLRDTRVTSARLFYRKGNLNVIFGAVDFDLAGEIATSGTATPKTSGRPTVDPALLLDRHIGYQKQARNLDWSPVLSPGAAFHSASRNDWIVLDPAVILATSTEASSRHAQEPRATSPEPVTDPAQDAESNLEQKLKQLRRLYQNELIDEPLYREKVRELIDRYMNQPIQ